MNKDSQSVYLQVCISLLLIRNRGLFPASNLHMDSRIPSNDEHPGPPLSQSVRGVFVPLLLADSMKT
jgi:hypothetical protein